jgi:hypothetical protein
LIIGIYLNIELGLSLFCGWQIFGVVDFEKIEIQDDTKTEAEFF